MFMQLKQIYRFVDSVRAALAELARSANSAPLSSVSVDLCVCVCGGGGGVHELVTAINAALLAGELVEKFH